MAAFSTIKHPFEHLNGFLVMDIISTSDLSAYDLNFCEYFLFRKNMLFCYLLYNPHNN
jgi:hypothetical protein